MKKLLFCLLATIIFCLSGFAQTTTKKSSPEKEAAKEKARLRAKYAPFASNPSKELKKDTMSMDALLFWKAYYDSIYAPINLGKLQYFPNDGIHKTLVVIAEELNTVDVSVAQFEREVNERPENENKFYEARKNVSVKDGNVSEEKRSVVDLDNLPIAYMIWIEGGEEPDSATLGELPDTSIDAMSLTEYLNWQIYLLKTTGRLVDMFSSTICSGTALRVRKKAGGNVFPIASCPDGILKIGFLEEKNPGNLSNTGIRSVFSYETYKKIQGKKKAAQKAAQKK